MAIFNISMGCKLYTANIYSGDWVALVPVCLMFFSITFDL